MPQVEYRHTGVYSEDGFEMHSIALKGAEIRREYSLPDGREATKQEILHCPNSFLQVLGRRGGSDQIASMSFGLAAREQKASEVIKSVVKGRGRLAWYGSDQVTVFIEEDEANVDPEAIIRDTVLGPKEVYKNIRGLTAQADVQDDRLTHLLSSSNCKGRFFIDVLNGTAHKLTRALQEDATGVFVWENVVRGNEIWAMDLDNQPMSWTTLALDERVEPAMRNNLLDVQKFLAETPHGKNRWVIKLNFDKTVDCCVNATNVILESAKISDKVVTKFDIKNFSKLNGLDKGILGGICPVCGAQKVKASYHQPSCQCDEKDRRN